MVRDKPRMDDAALRRNGPRFGFAAGLLAALAFLAAVVVVRLLTGATSVPEILADGTLLLLPGSTFSSILDSLQRAAKPLLFFGIGLGTLVVGGLVGRWYGTRPGWGRAAVVAMGLWLFLEIGVYTLVGAGPFGVGLQAGPVWHGLSLLVLLALFAAVLHESFATLARQIEDPSAPSARRRAMLNVGLLVGVAAVVGGAGWQLLSMAGRAGAAAARAVVANPPPFDVPGLSPEVTPSSSFYTVSKNVVDPTVGESGWKLQVDGLVDRPLSFSYDDLRALPASEGSYTLMCISNEVGGDLLGNAVWKGVKLKWLLGQAGVQPGALKAVFAAADDYHDSVRLERALHPDALLAWEMNGQPLPKEHGYPARLLIPGIYGMKNVKWLNRISLVAEDFKGYWQVRGWDDTATYQTASRFDVPRSRASVAAGITDVAGVAYAGDRGIQKVEISQDGGQTWQTAQLKPGLSPYTWQLWRARVDLAPGVRTLQVRATDGHGHLQVREPADPFPSGSTGYHTLTLLVG